MADLFLPRLVTDADGKAVASSVMVLWCDLHVMNHALSLGDVERLVYTLLAAEADAYDQGLKDGVVVGDATTMDIECPLAGLVRANSSEGYLEHVEECMARRVAAEVPR